MHGHTRLLAFTGFAFLIATGLFVRPASAVTIDTVISFTPGAGYGVFLDGPDTFDPSAVTSLDGNFLALGGTDSNPGQIVVSFSTGSVIDGTGADLRLYDTFGFGEGIEVEASFDGILFLSLGINPGAAPSGGDFCSLATPCISEFDLATAGLSSASFFRLTVKDNVVSNFPQAYDLDTVEAINFGPTNPVPLPAAFPLFAAGLGAVVLAARRRKQRRSIAA